MSTHPSVVVLASGAHAFAVSTEAGSAETIISTAIKKLNILRGFLVFIPFHLLFNLFAAITAFDLHCINLVHQILGRH